MGTTLIQVRQRFHPLNPKHFVLAMAGLTIHMLFQLWLYVTGRCDNTSGWGLLCPNPQHGRCTALYLFLSRHAGLM